MDQCNPPKSENWFRDGAFKCKKCPYSSTEVKELIHHIKYHTARPNIREEDGVFSNLQAIHIKNSDYASAKKESMMMHGKVKSHICDTCKQPFVDKHSLMRHKSSVHNKTRDHKCDRCEYAASRKDHLNQHKIKLHGETLYETGSNNAVFVNMMEFLPGGKELENDQDPLTITSVNECQYEESREAPSGNNEMQVKIESGSFPSQAENEKATNSQNDLVGPVERSEKKLELHYCNLCALSFTQRSFMLDHKNSVHFKIKECRVELSKIKWKYEESDPLAGKSGRLLSCHVKVKVPSEMTCSECRFTFSTSGNLMIHLRNIHSKNFQENQDTFDLNKSALSTDPKDVKLGIKKWACDICGYSPIRKSDLQAHIKKVHSKIKAFKCDFCEYASNQMRNIAIHKKAVHLKIKDCICTICDQAFSHSQTLNRHKRTQHGDIKDYNCNLCDHGVSTRLMLEMHKVKVHGEENNLNYFKCDICEYKTYEKSKLIIHNRVVHNKIKDYNCDICNKVFGHSQTLNRHKRIVHFGKKLDIDTKTQYVNERGAVMHGIISENGFTTVKEEIALQGEAAAPASTKIIGQKVKEWVCDTCGYSTELKDNLIKHVHRKRWKNEVNIDEEQVQDKNDDNDEAPLPVEDNEKSSLVVEMYLNDSLTIAEDDTTLPEEPKKVGKRTKSENELCIAGIDDWPSLTVKSESLDAKPWAREYSSDKMTNLQSDIERTHGGIKKYKCDRCEYAAHGEKKVILHKRTVHEKIKEYICNICNCAFGLLQTLHRHKAAKHGEVKSYTCELCEHTETTQLLLKTHKANTHGDIKHKCEVCEFTSYQKSKIRRHNRAIHEKIKDYMCDICSRNFGQMQTLLRHKRVQHEKIKKEEVKEESSNTKNMLKEAVHSDKKSAHVCKECGYKASLKSGLHQHINSVHLKLKEWVCDVCGYAAALKKTLMEHVHSIHWKVKPFKCEECEFATSSRKSLTRHVKGIHLGMKSFKRDVCDYASSDKASVILHGRAVHDKVKGYICDKCGRTFAEKQNLNRHKSTVHNKLREHKCDKCEYVASRIDHLHRHKTNAHQHNLNESEEDVSSTSTQKLNEEVEFVPPEETAIQKIPKVKEWVCDMCGYVAGQKDSLVQHVHTNHWKSNSFGNNSETLEEHDGSKVEDTAPWEEMVTEDVQQFD